MRKAIKIFILALFKYLCLFHFTKYRYKKRLSILCYHNISDGDEVAWRPWLYISPGRFKKRLEYLERNNFKVISLDEALNLLYKNELPDHTVVITFDDGWYYAKKYGHPILKDMCIPYTIYMTSYFSEKEMPVHDLIIAYMFWKANDTERIKALNDLGVDAKDLSDIKLVAEVIKYAKGICDDMELFLETLGNRLGIEYRLLAKNRIFNLLTKQEIHELNEDGASIQLHSHRHILPLDHMGVAKEIMNNIKALEPYINNPLEHFSYPNGDFDKAHFIYLEEMGIKSAVTCKSGYNDNNTNPYQLHRFLDSESISQIEFEAEMCGIFEFARKIRRRFLSIRS